jgi:hypothetical protein
VTLFKKNDSNNLIKKNKMTNSATPENYPQDEKNFQNANTDPKSSDPNSNPYDLENLDNESESESNDITEKDNQEDLREKDSSGRFETDMDTQGSDEPEGATFETIEPKKDNPVNKEFEIGNLGNEQLKEDELTRNETGDSALHNTKPSQRKF